MNMGADKVVSVDLRDWSCIDVTLVLHADPARLTFCMSRTASRSFGTHIPSYNDDSARRIRTSLLECIMAQIVFASLSRLALSCSANAT